MLRKTPLKRGTKQLKRSGFKKKTKPLRKKSKSNIKKLQDKLWELCKQITRLRYGNVCYTCGKTGLIGSDWHTSHFIPKASVGAYLKYDLRILRPSCYHCNINLGGNGAEYYRRMVLEIGQKQVDKIFDDKRISIKADEIWYKEKILEYEVYLNQHIK